MTGTALVLVAGPPDAPKLAAGITGPVLPGPNGTASTVRTALLVLAEVGRTLRLIDFDAVEELAVATGEQYTHLGPLLAAGRAFTELSRGTAGSPSPGTCNPAGSEQSPR